MTDFHGAEAFRTDKEQEVFESFIKLPETPGLDLRGRLLEAWVAARDYFDRPTQNEDRQRAETTTASATISIDDFHLRHLALSFAVEPGRTRADILASAKEYLNFLSGADTSAKEAGS